MKISLQFLIIISLGLHSYSQPFDTTRLNYKGGMPMLTKAVFFYLGRHSSDGVLGPLYKNNRYFFLRFTVLENGDITKNVAIFSAQDTTNTAAILATIQNTSGNWINRTGKELSVALLISIQYTSDTTGRMPLLPIKYNEYTDGSPSDIVYLPPITIQIFPPTYDYWRTPKGKSN
jgi:hypothetical protein